MPKKQKSPAPEGARLANFVCANKQTVKKSLSQFKSGGKSKEEVEAVADVFFETMCRLNLGAR